MLPSSSNLLLTSASELSSLACSSVGGKGKKRGKVGTNKFGESPLYPAQAGLLAKEALAVDAFRRHRKGRQGCRTAQERGIGAAS